MKRNKQIDIRRALALATTFNFLCCCARACLLPFLTLYLRQLGLTAAMIGIIMGSKRLMVLVWSPVASLVSKHYDKRRVVITGSLVCSAAAALALLLLVPPTGVHTLTTTCNTSELRASPDQSVAGDLLTSSAGATTSPARAQSGVTFPANTLPDTKPGPADTSKTSPHHQSHPEQVSVVVNNSHGEPNISGSLVTPVRRKRSQSELPEEERREEIQFDFLHRLKLMDPQDQLFFFVLIVVLVWEFAAAPLEWTADDGVYEYLDFADASDRYSSNGVWGILGAAVGAGGAGLLVSQLNCLIGAQMPRTAVHFYCYAGLAALTLPVVTFLPLYLNKKRDRATGFLKAVQLVRDSHRALLCAVTTLLVGVAGSAVEDFLLWQMQDQGSSELHMGLSLALALLSEAAFPLLARRVSRLLSPGRVLTVGAAILSLQCFYYSFLWGPWAVLPAQVLSCFSRGALWWAVRVQCEEVATPGAERSVWRVYAALSLHLGGGLGSLAGGFVVQRFGLAWLFRGAAVGLLAWCLVLPPLQLRAPRQRRINYSRLLAADGSEASDSDSEQERDWLEKAMEDDRSNNNYGRRMNH
ncbi:major facilitator superfamily domain-containing protein 6-like [Mastacembelus armatus]|uniref:major facilitator superfamily domain-containing protein 6-like n=1 Tax=Mastacembelus armatus TaxID=205130 RepID=UPI000E462A83|nr:major facilitator superfamily domain-containing protein 6-like [Mastacembelus armatus]